MIKDANHSGALGEAARPAQTEQRQCRAGAVPRLSASAPTRRTPTPAFWCSPPVSGQSCRAAKGRELSKKRGASPRVGDTALVDGENFDLVVARQNNFTRGSADQSPRDGRDIRY